MFGICPRNGKSEAIRDLVGRSARTIRPPPGPAVESKRRLQIASEVPLGEDEGLPKTCVANCHNLRMVARLSLTNRAGELAPERWIEVKRAVGAAFGWRELTDLD